MYTQYMAASSQNARPTADALNGFFDGSRYFRLYPNQSGVPEAQVFLKVDDISATTELQQLGVEVVSRIEDIIVARMPITQSYVVAGLSNVRSIQISGQSKPLLNLSRVEAKVDAVHQGTGGLDRPYRGNGVIVGILDSGIDWGHQDFNTAPANTRIQYLYDYSSGLNGVEYTKAQIDGGFCDEIDGPEGRGHGTHVSGIAAGNGRTNAGYIGMAPGADIVFVKGFRAGGASFDDADVVNGVNYIFTKARAAERPAAVNLSLGGQFGPHDGTSLYEQALSSLVRPGNIIVAAAGNEGGDLIHGGYTAAAGTGYIDALETLVGVYQNAETALIDMWYPAAGGSTISVGIAAYQIGNYSTPLAFTNPVVVGQFIQNVELSNGGTALGQVTIDAQTTSDPNNGARRVVFFISGPNISNYAWSVYTFGNGTFDMWAVSSCEFPEVGGLPSYFRQGNTDKTVGSPATAKKLIAVGSYVSKTSWIDIDDVTRVQNGATLSAISGFSSHGPSRDGRVLPHISAPGEAILSVLSSALILGTDVPRAEVLQGGELQKLQGTSMASPHVAGVVALLLERNRYLTRDNVISLLSSTAVSAGGTVPNNTFGAGKMHALNALLATPAGVDCATLARTTGVDCDGNRIYTYQLLNAYPNPFNPATTIGFTLEKPEKVDLAVYDMLGRRIRELSSEELTAGLHQILWDGTNSRGDAVASGVYFTRLVTPGYSASHRLMLLK